MELPSRIVSNKFVIVRVRSRAAASRQSSSASSTGRMHFSRQQNDSKICLQSSLHFRVNRTKMPRCQYLVFADDLELSSFEKEAKNTDSLPVLFEYARVFTLWCVMCDVKLLTESTINNNNLFIIGRRRRSKRKFFEDFLIRLWRGFWRRWNTFWSNESNLWFSLHVENAHIKNTSKYMRM